LASSKTNFLKISDLLWKYANETPSRVPFSDWYFTDGNGGWVSFRARSVVGGHWMKVYMDKLLSGEIGTAIAPIRADEVGNKVSKYINGWYNLSGQKIDEPVQRGIYIKDGKTIVK
jgi:hypothetical protein